MQPILTYHNDPALKARIIEQARHHLAADMLVRGTYGNRDGSKFRGCSVGCFANDIDPERSDYHAVVAEHAGWPEWLVRLSDALFEGLPEGERDAFHVALREVVPVGVDIEPVRYRLSIARHQRQLARLEGNAEPYAQQVCDALRGVITWCEAQTAGAGSDAQRSVAESAESARSAAWSARSAAWSAESVARSAAWSAESAAWSAESAARSAAWSAESAATSAARSARSAAWSAAWSAESAARSAEYQFERDALLSLLEAA